MDIRLEERTGQPTLSIRRVVGKMAWEIYITDPGQEPDASKWQSEVCWLVK